MMKAKVSSLSQKYIKVKEEDRHEISTIKIMVKEIIRIDIGQGVEISFNGRIQYGLNNRDRTRYNEKYRGEFRRGNFRGNVHSNNYTGQNYRGGYRRNHTNNNYERGKNRSRDR